MDTLLHYIEIIITKAATNGASEIRASCFPRDSASIIVTMTDIDTLALVLLKLLTLLLNIQLLMLLVMPSLEPFRVL